MGSESSCGTEASSSHCDVVLVNGDSNGLSSDCSTESSVDPDNPLLQHRDNMCLDAIYNLYAISVSTTRSHCHTRIFNSLSQWEVRNDFLLHLISAIQESWEEATM